MLVLVKPDSKTITAFTTPASEAARGFTTPIFMLSKA